MSEIPPIALCKALSKFQGEVADPKADTENTYFKSKYATLAGVLQAVRPLLQKHGLSVTQGMKPCEHGFLLRTVLWHESGGSIDSELPVPLTDKDTPQSIGSKITYARRYTLQAILGIASEQDDDAEAAMQRTQAGSSRPAPAADSKPARAGSTPARPATPVTGPSFALVEEAVAAMRAAKTVDDLHALVPRLQASKFKGADYDTAHRVLQARRLELAKPPAAAPTS